MIVEFIVILTIGVIAGWCAKRLRTLSAAILVVLGMALGSTTGYGAQFSRWRRARARMGHAL